ncbi:MAG: amidase [Thermoleophilaceae bacterium]|nr:amidase [Thermoleophilaceae bacterium]
MGDSEILCTPAVELAAGVRNGDYTSRELTELALAKIEELDPTLNAFTMTDADRALAAADAVETGDDRPFAGVPTAIKDIGAMVDGYPFTCGSRIFGDFVAPFDSHVARRIKDAGFVIVGKTNLPELGILPVSESSRYGAVRNPYDTDRTPGGSSGGAGAAVASGMLPIAHGSDGAGSLRIPAACCGLVGLKASRNRISPGPVLAESPMVTEGFLTRSVADAAATLDVLAGYESGDANWAPPPSGTFLEAARRDPGKLRIAVSVKPSIDVPVASEHLENVAETARLLESLGHEVVEFDPPFNSSMLEFFMDVWAIGISSLARSGAQLSGQEVTPDTVEALTWAFWERGNKIKALDMVMVDNTLKGFARQTVAALEPFDALLTPTLNLRPVEIGWIDASHGMPAFDRAVQFTSFTAGANLSGLPAVSLPTGIEKDGLPGSVQLIGGPAGEESLLSLAGQLEDARPFAQLRPRQ